MFERVVGGEEGIMWEGVKEGCIIDGVGVCKGKGYGYGKKDMEEVEGGVKEGGEGGGGDVVIGRDGVL